MWCTHGRGGGGCTNRDGRRGRFVVRGRSRGNGHSGEVELFSARLIRLFGVAGAGGVVSMPYHVLAFPRVGCFSFSSNVCASKHVRSIWYHMVESIEIKYLRYPHNYGKDPFLAKVKKAINNGPFTASCIGFEEVFTEYACQARAAATRLDPAFPTGFKP